MFAAALFDMDGLLIDSERAIMDAWMQVAGGMGFTFSEGLYAEVIGRAAAESDEILARAFGSRQRLRDAQDEVDRLLERRPPAERFPLKRGAARLLQDLERRGVPCAVASSSARGEIEARLEAVGVRGHFIAIAGGDEVAAGKPDPALYRLAASRAGFDAARCLAFEDSRNGARSALASGASLVLVPDLVLPSEDIAGRSLCVLGSLEEALPRVEAWFPA